jgi:agmatine deiminase
VAVSKFPGQNKETPLNAGFFMPAEWHAHTSCWLAWPASSEAWGKHLDGARQQFTALCHAMVTGGKRAERLEILVIDAEHEQEAKRALHGISARFHRIPYGDIWLRDTGPIFLTHPLGKIACVSFGFNGWGGKYRYTHDDTVSRQVAEASSLDTFRFDWVFEGGAIDVDGEGTCLASYSCLLDPARSPERDTSLVEERLRQALGLRKVIWIDGSLQNDHTDGHVDTLARYVAPGVVVCMQAIEADDPNRAVLTAVAEQLGAAIDSQGRKLTVLRVPSPGRVRGDEHEVMPASYLNFYVGNTAVVVPTYGSVQDDQAVSAIANLFPERRVIGLRANHILEGGGAFHCITQQQPAFIAARTITNL